MLLLLRELLDTTLTLAVADKEETGLEEVTETVNTDDTTVKGATVVTVTDDVEFVTVAVVDVVVVIVADSWDCSEAVEMADTEVVVEADEEFEMMALDVVIRPVVVLVELHVDITVAVVTAVLAEVALALLLVLEALLLGCSCFCCCSLCNRVVTPVGPLRTSARLF